jgi:hypothetical protein
MFNLSEACDRPKQGDSSVVLQSDLCEKGGISIAYCDKVQIKQGCSDCENCPSYDSEEKAPWKYEVNDECDASHYIKQGNSSCHLNPPMQLSDLLSLSTQNTLAIYTDENFNKNIELSYDTMKNLSNYFYDYFNDSFDFIFIVCNNLEIPDDVHYYGRFYSVQNSIEGLGKYIYDNSDYFGSNSKLKGMMHFPYRSGINNGPTLHELSHSWANSLIDTGMGGHWNYTGFFAKTSNGAKGQLGGFDASTFKDEENGKYSASGFGTFANGGNSLPYNDVELYLMGLIPMGDVGDVMLSSNAKYDKYANGRIYFTADSVVKWDFATLIDDLGFGNRVPNSENSQKSFRILTVLVGDKKPTEEEIAQINSYMNIFTLDNNDSSDYFYNFYEATGGRATLEANNLRNSIK